MTTSVGQSPDRLQGETGGSEIDATPFTLSGGPLDTGTAREVLSGRLSGSQATPPASPPAGGGGAKTGSAHPTKEGAEPLAGGASGAASAHLSGRPRKDRATLAGLLAHGEPAGVLGRAVARLERLEQSLPN